MTAQEVCGATSNPHHGGWGGRIHSLAVAAVTASCDSNYAFAVFHLCYSSSAMKGWFKYVLYAIYYNNQLVYLVFVTNSDYYFYSCTYLHCWTQNKPFITYCSSSSDLLYFLPTNFSFPQDVQKCII